MSLKQWLIEWAEASKVGLRNLTNLTFLTRLALWWLTRQLLKDKGLYQSYHANVAITLCDVQRRPGGSEEPFDMRDPESRNYVASAILELLFSSRRFKSLR